MLVAKREDRRTQLRGPNTHIVIQRPGRSPKRSCSAFCVSSCIASGFNGRLAYSLAVTSAFTTLVLSFVIVRKLQVRVLLEACMQNPTPSCEMTADRPRVSRLLERLAAR